MVADRLLESSYQARQKTHNRSDALFNSIHTFKPEILQPQKPQSSFVTTTKVKPEKCKITVKPLKSEEEVF